MINSFVTLVSLLCITTQCFSQLSLSKDPKTGKFGFTNDDKEWVIPSTYDAGEDFFDNAFTFVKLNGKWGLIDQQGNVMLPFTYDRIFNDELEYGIRNIVVNKRYGLVDQLLGKEVISCQYDTRIIFDEGELMDDQSYAVVIKNNKAGILGSEPLGLELISCSYDIGKKSFERLEGSLIRAWRDNKAGVINSRGLVFVPFEYDQVDHNAVYDTIHFDVQRKGKYGVYSAQLKKEILPTLYDTPIYFEDGDLSPVRRNKKYGMINQLYIECIPAIYDEEFQFFENENHALVRRNNKYGVVDRAGQEVIACTLSREAALDELNRLTAQ